MRALTSASVTGPTPIRVLATNRESMRIVQDARRKGRSVWLPTVGDQLRLIDSRGNFWMVKPCATPPGRAA